MRIMPIAWVIISCQATAFRLTKVPFLHGVRSSLHAASDNKGAPPQTAYSYVEGGDYEDRREEIEAMGGDPFFLSDEEEDVAVHADEAFATNLETPMGGGGSPTAGGFEEDRYATDGKGPTPRDLPTVETNVEDWEWDGTVDEDAHLLDF